MGLRGIVQIHGFRLIVILANPALEATTCSHGLVEDGHEILEGRTGDPNQAEYFPAAFTRWKVGKNVVM